MKLFVVTTNSPGPGAGPLVRMKATDLEAKGYVLGMVDQLADAADGACEFVELEDEHGCGHGPAVGVGWDEHPATAGLKRLGPFVPARLVQSMDQIESAIMRGWMVLVAGHPHFRDGGQVSFQAKYGNVFIEGGAETVTEAHEKLIDQIRTAESNSLGPQVEAVTGR